MTINYMLCGLLALFANLTLAQTLTGRVTSPTGEGIPLAGVVLLNSTKGTTTDKDGNFALRVEAGTYQVSVRAVGFASRIQSVSIAENQTFTLNLALTENTNSLDEVVVTAEKEETNLQRTPAAVSVLNARQLQEYRVWSVSDLSALAPSLYTVEHGNSTSATFLNIRGVMGFSAEQAVAMYVDGVYQFDYFSAPLQFNNIASVEVLRGPQGTLFGRNAFGGVVNITTKKPTNRTEGFAQLTLGNYGQQRYEASLSTPLVKNKLFLGVTGLFNQRSGIYTNLTTNAPFDRLHSVSGGLNLRYVAADRWNLALNLRMEADNDRGSYPWYRSDSAAFASPYRLAVNTTNRERRTNLNASIAANYYGNKVNFTAVSSYINFHLWYPDRFDGTPYGIYQGSNDGLQHAFTQELRFSSATQSNPRLKWTLGSFLFAQNGTTVFSVFSAPAEGGSANRTSSNTTNLGVAFFGQAAYRVADKLTLTAGLRYDVENRKLGQQVDSVTANGVAFNQVPLTNLKAMFPAVTPKLILAYQINDQSMLYAQYARGFRVGGLNASAPTLADIPYGPEFSNNYEIGLKNTLWHNRLRLNLTGFYLQQRNQQVSVNQGGFFLIRNTGDMNNLGAELEAFVVAAKGLQVEANASLSHARYSRLTTLDATFSNADFRGNRPINTPNAASFLAVQYTYALPKMSAVFIRGEHRYTGVYYFDFDNAKKQDPFHVVNLRLGVTYRTYELAGWVRNVTDQRYITFGVGGSYLLSNPRMSGITLTARF